MPRAYLAVLRKGGSTQELLLGCKNLYLQPHGRYQYAKVARHALQWVIPGGHIPPGESPAETATREFHETTGVRVAAADVRLLHADAEEFWFVHHADAAAVDEAGINLALTEGRTESRQLAQVAWVPLEQVPSWLGMKPGRAAPRWAEAQFKHGLAMGFTPAHMAQRAQESSRPFLLATARLILDVLDPGARQPPAPPVAPPSEPARS